MFTSTSVSTFCHIELYNYKVLFVFYWEMAVELRFAVSGCSLCESYNRGDSLFVSCSSEVYHIRGISVRSPYPSSILSFTKAL